MNPDEEEPEDLGGAWEFWNGSGWSTREGDSARLLSGLPAEGPGSLLREPRLLASVSHPNIVSIITAEKEDNVFFIVMEYVPGETLENLIAARGPLDLNPARTRWP